MISVYEAIRRAGDDLQFFQAAYLWAFGKTIDVFGDVLAFRTQGLVPKYVEKYVTHIFA